MGKEGFKSLVQLNQRLQKTCFHLRQSLFESSTERLMDKEEIKFQMQVWVKIHEHVTVSV